MDLSFCSKHKPYVDLHKHTHQLFRTDKITPNHQHRREQPKSGKSPPKHPENPGKQPESAGNSPKETKHSNTQEKKPAKRSAIHEETGTNERQKPPKRRAIPTGKPAKSAKKPAKLPDRTAKHQKHQGNTLRTRQKLQMCRKPPQIGPDTVQSTSKLAKTPQNA